jgi:DNA-directed RNA polymerase subunit RPC12/RpoP
MRVAKKRFKFPSNKLDYVAQKLGIGEKVKHSGFELWVKCMAGDDKAWREMKKYQIQDVDLLVGMYEKFRPWIHNHPNRAITDDVSNGCLTCGSTHLQSRGFEVLSTGKYRKFQCQDCGKWMRGAKSEATSTMRSI